MVRYYYGRHQQLPRYRCGKSSSPITSAFVSAAWINQINKWAVIDWAAGERRYLVSKTQTAGMEMRFLEIRATLCESEEEIKRMEVFNSLHNLTGGAALSERLKSNMSRAHGTAYQNTVKGKKPIAVFRVRSSRLNEDAESGLQNAWLSVA